MINSLRTFGIIGSFILFLATGCGKKPAPVEEKKEEEKKIVIEFMNWESSPEGQALVEGLIEKFEQRYPDVKVRNNIVPSGAGYGSKLLTRIASGTAPDLWEQGADGVQYYIKKDTILNLTPYIEKSRLINKEDFFPAALIKFRWDGKHLFKGDLYVYGKDLGTMALIYNKDLFDKAGLAYPDETWTGKEFLETAQALTKREKSRRPIQIGIDQSPHPLDILVQKGGKIWSEDYKKCLLNSKEAKEAFQYVYDLQEKYRVALRQEEYKEQDPLTKGFGFAAGRAGMSIIGRWQMPDLIRDIGGRFSWDVAPYPLFGKKKIFVLHGPTGWAISAKTKHPEESFHFLEVLIGPEGQLATAKAGWNLPSNKKIAYSDAFLKNLDHPHSEKINRIFLAAAENRIPIRYNPYLSPHTFYLFYKEKLHHEVIRKHGGKVGPVLEMATKEMNGEIATNLSKEAARQ